MSAEDTLNEKSKRRRGLRRQAEVEPVDAVEPDELDVDDEVEGDEDVSSRGLTEKKGRVTPGRRTQEIAETQSEGNFLTRTLRGVSEYFEGVNAERKKVVWPTPQDVRRLTRIVLVTLVIASLILGTISILFNELFVIGLQSPAVFAVLFVIVVGIFIYYLRQSNRRTSSY